MHRMRKLGAVRLGGSFLAGGLAGAAIALAMLELGIDDPLSTLDAEDTGSLLIAALLFFAGAFTVWAAGSPHRYRRMVERREDDEPTDPVAMRTGRQSGIVCLLAAIILAIPPLAANAALAEPLRIAAFAAILALLLVETVVNWRIWRDGDELTRSVVVATGAACFWVGQLLLFTWAAMAKLGLVADVGSWAILTAWMALYLVASVVIQIRRGFAQL